MTSPRRIVSDESILVRARDPSHRLGGANGEPDGRTMTLKIIRQGRLLNVVAAVALVSSACAAAAPVGGGAGTADLGSCGTIPSIAPADPDGALAALPDDVVADYNGLATPVTASAWAKWAPDHPAPYRVAIAWNPPVNPFVTSALAGVVETLEASGQVEIVANVAPSAPSDVPGQLQQVNQIIAERPDLIILQPLAAGPAAGVVDAAGQAGIPVVSAWALTPSPYAVGVSVNNFLQAARLASEVVKQMNGQGEVLLVRGIPGIQQDAEAQAGFRAVLDGCPGITVAGEVTGGYSNATTQAATLQFLTTHPGSIGGVLQSGTMGVGVIGAFQQLGRPVPAIADLGTTQGTVAYAQANPDTFSLFGSASADTAIGRTIGEVALRLLGGKGPRVNQLVTQPQYLFDVDVAALHQPGWTVDSALNVAAPDDPFMSDDRLAAYFTAGGAP